VLFALCTEVHHEAEKKKKEIQRFHQRGSGGNTTAAYVSSTLYARSLKRCRGAKKEDEIKMRKTTWIDSLKERRIGLIETEGEKTERAVK
jgi:hypothetical protein